MFVRVEVIGQVLTPNRRFLMNVVDTKFIESVEVEYVGPGLNTAEILTGIVAAYEKRNLNVAANLAYVCKGWKVDPNNYPALDKYRPQIDRYLMLI